MTCDELNNNLDDYLDDALDADASASLEIHADGCDACRQVVGEARKLQNVLAKYGESTAAQADQAFFDRALLRASHNGSRRQRNRWMMTGFSAAIAAGLVVWLIGGMLLQSPTMPDSAIPEITMALEEPRTVNLVFSSADELVDATLTVTLPDGLELAGFQGQREVTWMTSLSKGKNVLPLQLIATMPQSGELMATLRHEDDDRTFRLQVTVI